MLKEEDLCYEILSCAYAIHTALGPGLLESTYESCLAHELELNGYKVEKQVKVPIVYKGLVIDVAYRIDLLVEDKIILELKSVEKLTEIHTAQLLTYLKMSKHEIGYLINFNVSSSLKNGIKRLVL